MKSSQYLTPLFLSFFVIAVSTKPTLAVEPLSAKELASHCVVYPESPDSLDGQFCSRYIQGFVDGAVATDVQVMLNVEAKYEKVDKETLTERAARTRGSMRDLEKTVEPFAEYCLGEEIKLAELVNTIVDHLNNRGEIDSSILARRVVYGILKAHYPCQQQKSEQN